MALLVVRLAIGYVRLESLLQTSQAVPEELVAEVGRIAAALGCRRAVQVRSSRQIAVPFMYGLRRPVLVLPERMCQPAYRRQLPGVIAHELAHVVSRDFAWNAALQAVSILLWFHPLAWRIGSAHRAACDAVCDAISAASYLGDVQRLLPDARARSRWRRRRRFPPRDWRWPGPATFAAASPCSSGGCLRRPWAAERSPARLLAGLLASRCWRACGLRWRNRRPRRLRAESATVAGKGQAGGKAGQARVPSRRPVSMSAEAFGRLSAAEQRALLVRVFQRHLEHSHNLYYETDES